MFFEGAHYLLCTRNVHFDEQWRVKILKNEVISHAGVIISCSSAHTTSHVSGTLIVNQSVYIYIQM